LLAFREAVADLGWQVRRWMGYLVECVDERGREHVVGLENLYRQARQEERALWPGLIAEFLKTVKTIEESTGLPGDLASVAQNVLVRLGPPLATMTGDARVWSQPLPGTNLFLNLVVDYPNRMCYVTEKLVVDSGKPGSDWLRQALTNLQTRTPPDCLKVIDEESGIALCSVADAYDSSRSLILDVLRPECRRDGFFIALPGRDQLLVLPVSVQALSYAHLLKILADKNYQSAPYPISNEVFWVREGAWHSFSITLRAHEADVEPPEEFLEVLKRLVPPEELHDMEKPPEE
jgi:hypothetical protein